LTLVDIFASPIYLKKRDFDPKSFVFNVTLAILGRFLALKMPPKMAVNNKRQVAKTPDFTGFFLLSLL
jgi:hypothetical protein